MRSKAMQKNYDLLSYMTQSNGFSIKKTSD